MKETVYGYVDGKAIEYIENRIEECRKAMVYEREEANKLDEQLKELVGSNDVMCVADELYEIVEKIRSCVRSYDRNESQMFLYQEGLATLKEDN